MVTKCQALKAQDGVATKLLEEKDREINAVKSEFVQAKKGARAEELGT